MATAAETPGPAAPDDFHAASSRSERGDPIRIEPDLDFIRALRGQGGDTLKHCFQCGTCSATCSLAPDTKPFPRKEMAWAVWGMRDRLLADPDVWLCHQCNDCSTRCPRGARPGDVLAAVRRQGVQEFAFPRFLGRWVNQPHMAPFLLGLAAALLTLAIAARDPVEALLGITKSVDERIVYAYSKVFPHWLLNGFFGFFSVLVLLAVLVGALRFWRAMRRALPREKVAEPAKGLLASIASTVGAVFAHRRFTQCTTAGPRFLSHACVFFGFLALTLVTLWVITAGINPLIRGDFVYPFGFWNPWKILANLGGAALIAGCLLMIRDRLRGGERVALGTYFDWALISTLLLVAASGFVTELLHYLRLEPHRHIAYFAHLVFVFVVLVYLPYSKLAHLVYRFTAMLFAERHGRDLPPAGQGPGQEG